MQGGGYRATVAERLACSPPTKANRTRSPAGSPDFRKWESCQTMPLVGGSSRGISRFPHPLIPALLHIHFNHPLRLSRPRFTFAIGSQLIRPALHASEPIADVQGNNLRIPLLSVMPLCPFPRASRTLSESGHAHIKAIDTSFRLCTLIYSVSRRMFRRTFDSLPARRFRNRWLSLFVGTDIVVSLSCDSCVPEALGNLIEQHARLHYPIPNAHTSVKEKILRRRIQQLKPGTPVAPATLNMTSLANTMRVEGGWGDALQVFRKWGSCQMLPLVGRFSRVAPVSLALAFRRYTARRICESLDDVTKLRLVLGWGRRRHALRVSEPNSRLARKHLANIITARCGATANEHTAEAPVCTGLRSLAYSAGNAVRRIRNASCATHYTNFAFGFVRARLARSLAQLVYLPDAQGRPNFRTCKTSTLYGRAGSFVPLIGGASLSGEISLPDRPIIMVSLLASRLDEPGSNPCGLAPGFSHVGIMPGDVTGRRGFTRETSFPPALAFRRRSIPHFSFIVYQDLDVGRHLNLFTT
ncbi:hypothetical protein PR048_026369 [Dryococelus australis]|uniref:Uncharacterized protein n=1 Tax=Dryococelus australis TaxID=614101 RepID=A0ABQ9GL68_9NEOP|nr:hypothetical protein PR048_026369 [Dryococelus australis]